MRRYHHIGIPTTEAKPGETHLKRLKLSSAVTQDRPMVVTSKPANRK